MPTKRQILDRLEQIADVNHFLGTDLVMQEDLFEIQAILGKLMIDIANEMGRGEHLAKKFPYAFSTGGE